MAKRKFKIGLTLGILIPVVLIGTPIALAYGMFYDASPSQATTIENFQKETVIKDVIHNSFNGVKENKALQIGLHEDVLNSMFLEAAKQMNEQLTDYVNAPYVKIDSKNHKMDFFLHLDVPMFKTKLTISTNMEVQHHDENKQEGIVFKINDIALGRQKGIDKFAVSVAKKYVNDETITSLFSNAGFNITASLENRTLFYPARDLIADITKSTPLNDMYLSMMDLAVDNSLIDVAYNDETFGIKLNLDKLTNNLNFVDQIRDNKLSEYILKFFSKAETLLNGQIITENQVGDIMHYLAQGYKNVEKRIQDLVITLDLKSIGISDNESYKGLDLNNETVDKIDEVFAKQVLNKDFILNPVKTVSFTEEGLNQTLSTSSIIGKCYPFTSKVNNKFKLNAIFIDDFYVTILKDHINFILSVNFNGLSTKLIIPCKVISQDGKTIKLKIDGIKYGELAANQKIETTCLKYITDALSNLTDWFKKDENTTDIVFFDLNKCVAKLPNNEADPYEPYDILKDASIESAIITGDKLEDNGELKITFKI